MSGILGRVNGPMLKENLLRQGVDLAFDTDLLYLDVNNRYLGVNTTMPLVELDVNGKVRIGGNLKIQGANLSSNVTDGNIDLTPNGAGVVNVATSLHVSSNANVGNLSVTGNINGANLVASTAVYSPSIINGTSNVTIDPSGNVNVSVGGAANVLTVTSGGFNLTGNANVGNIGATDAVLSGNIKIGGDSIKSSTGNVAISLSDTDVIVYGNLDIKGAVTVIESTVTTVNDLNLILGNNASTSIALDGGGIDLGSNNLVTWRYNHLTTSWQSNVSILPATNNSINLGGTSNYWANAYLANLFVSDVKIANNTVTTSVSNGNLNINANGSGIITFNSPLNSANVAFNGISANLLYVDGSHNRIGVLTNTIPAGAVMKVATDSSVILPTGDTSTRPATPLQAMFRFNTDTLNYEFYDGAAWKQASSVFTTISADEYIGDGSTAIYALSQSSTTNGTLVAVDGNVQVPSVAYTVSSNTLTFQPAFIPAAGKKIDIRVLTTTTTVTSLSENDTSIGITDSGSNGTITLTTDAGVKLVANAYINANTALVSVISNVSVGASTVVVDSFDMSKFRSAKYLLQVSNTGRGDYETSEYIALHNGSTAFGTSYAVVYSNVELGSTSVAVNAGNVELRYTGNYAGNNVRLFKEYVAL